MKAIGWYRDQAAKLEEEEFCERFPFAVLLHHWAEEPLRPTRDSHSETLNPFLMMDRLTPGQRTLPKENSYMVFGLAPKKPDATRLSIGSTEDTDVRIDDESISRFHAILSWEADTYDIRDFDSTAGTQINGEVLSGTVPRILASGDVVSLGYVDLIFLTPRALYRFIRTFFKS